MAEPVTWALDKLDWGWAWSQLATNPVPIVVWTAAFLVGGFVLGLLVRHVMALGQIAESSERIASLAKEAAESAGLRGELESVRAERDKLDAIVSMTKAERFCIARMAEGMGDSGRDVSASGSKLLSTLEALERKGILVHTIDSELYGVSRSHYTIALDWREFVHAHMRYFDQVSQHEAGM